MDKLKNIKLFRSGWLRLKPVIEKAKTKSDYERIKERAEDIFSAYSSEFTKGKFSKNLKTYKEFKKQNGSDLSPEEKSEKIHAKYLVQGKKLKNFKQIAMIINFHSQNL